MLCDCDFLKLLGLRQPVLKIIVKPFDVRFPKRSIADKDIYTVLQPDLCVIVDPSKIDERGCIGHLIL